MRPYPRIGSRWSDPLASLSPDLAYFSRPERKPPAAGLGASSAGAVVRGLAAYATCAVLRVSCTSRTGGRPNKRPYSRVNCGTLS